MKEMVAALIVTMLLALSPAWAADKKSLSSSQIKTLQEENTRLKKELEAYQNTKKDTADAQRVEAQRREAIESLKAVRSALNTGANLQEFKKYQIHSRIKVDALPDTPENEIIKKISDIYKDAVTFGIIRITGSISDSELEYFRSKYKNDVLLKQHEEINPSLVPPGTRHYANQQVLKYLMDMRPNDYAIGLAHDRNKIAAEAISETLIVTAEFEFSLSQFK